MQNQDQNLKEGEIVKNNRENTDYKIPKIMHFCWFGKDY